MIWRMRASHSTSEGLPISGNIIFFSSSGKICNSFLKTSNLLLRLLIKTAILMPAAKKDDVNIVQIESEGFNQEKVGPSLKSFPSHQIVLRTIWKWFCSPRWIWCFIAPLLSFPGESAYPGNEGRQWPPNLCWHACPQQCQAHPHSGLIYI